MPMIETRGVTAMSKSGTVTSWILRLQEEASETSFVFEGSCLQRAIILIGFCLPSPVFWQDHLLPTTPDA